MVHPLVTLAVATLCPTLTHVGLLINAHHKVQGTGLKVHQTHLYKSEFYVYNFILLKINQFRIFKNCTRALRLYQCRPTFVLHQTCVHCNNSMLGNNYVSHKPCNMRQQTSFQMKVVHDPANDT